MVDGCTNVGDTVVASENSPSLHVGFSQPVNAQGSSSVCSNQLTSNVLIMKRSIRDVFDSEPPIERPPSKKPMKEVQNQALPRRHTQKRRASSLPVQTVKRVRINVIRAIDRIRAARYQPLDPGD